MADTSLTLTLIVANLFLPLLHPTGCRATLNF